MSQQIKANLEAVYSKIDQAARASGRDPADISILAATKTRNVKEIVTALYAGVTLIGENTVQEALSKFEFLPPNIEKHMIGSLQLNKVRQAVRLFDLIQSVNSLELAEHISSASAEIEKVMHVLIEVNLAGEESKRGIDQDEVERLADQIRQLESVKLRGLMMMAPHLENPEELRPLFREMKVLFDEMRRSNNTHFDILSMGMSNDYVVAIEEGATLIRLGTTLFGRRGYT